MNAPRSLGAAAVLEPLQVAVVGGSISARGGATIRLHGELEPLRWASASRVAAQVERLTAVPEPLADRLSRWSTTPLPGVPLFLAVSLGAFLAVIYVGGFLAGVMGDLWAATISPILATAVPAVIPNTVLANAILWAIDGGLLAMLLVGIPYVLTFYLLLAMLEDSGYLTSAAVLTDRVFGALGLPGAWPSRCWPPPAATYPPSTARGPSARAASVCSARS